VRHGDEYVDPASLLVEPSSVRLVPDGSELIAGRGPTRSSLSAAVVRGLIEAVPTLAARIGSRTVRRATAVPRAAFTVTRTVVDGARRWWQQRGHCTSRGVQPSPPSSPRVAVLVGGLGSSSAQAAIDRLDVAALGYARPDVVRFSYAGGRIPGRGGGAMTGIAASPYVAADTLGDMGRAGERLADLLIAVADLGPPGVPIDVLSHSQGGIVTHVALARLATARPDVIARLGVVVTFGTPHHGAPLAASVSGLADDPVAGLALEALQDVVGTGIEPDATAVGQLAPGSTAMVGYEHLPWPAGPTLLSIAAWADVAVPAGRAEIDGATNVVVGVPGLDDHGRLPASPAATLEVALALAGLPPTCTTAVAALSGSVLAGVLDGSEQALAG